MKEESLVDIFRNRTRHLLRPRSSDVINRLFRDYEPFDTPSRSLLAGRCTFLGKRLYVIAQQKPKPEDFKSIKDPNILNYGMLTADDHSFILSLLKEAKREDPENTMIFTLIDTFGADISMYSAERFQAFFIAHLIKEFLLIPLRTISLILGEGGSGGALAIQVTDVRGQMEDAMYATAPPESMASIIFRDPKRIEEALYISKPTAKELKRLGVIDHIVPAPENVADCDKMVENIKDFLETAIKEVGRIKISKLIRRREERAMRFGIHKKTGLLYDLKRYLERPIKKAFKKPPLDIKIINYSSLTEVSDSYGEISLRMVKKEFIRCGEGKNSDTGKRGCGRLINLKELVENYNVCPYCGYSYPLDVSGWIDCLADPETFHEMDRNLTVYDLLDEDFITDYYRDFLKRQEGRTDFKESLVTGTARINHFQVVLAISSFYYCGGSMGVVFGEKFRRAVDYAIEEGLPFISVCCSGGARLYEGISALMQMVKVVAAVNKLKKHGLPFISILADPSTGGAIASYAALGDIIIAEPGALIIFTGPRVMKSRGFEIDEKRVRSEHLHEISKKIYERLNYFHDIRGIQEICGRKDMKYAITKYLEFYHRTKGPVIKIKKSKARLLFF